VPPSAKRPFEADIFAGVASGAGATATFSLALSVLSAIGRGIGEPPPRRIIRTLLGRMGVRLDRRSANLVATLAHIGYGSAAGLPFRALPAKHRRRLAIGLGYGALLWAVSYAGWVPALGALPLPHRDRKGRPSRMILAHLVYGATLTALDRLFENRPLRTRPEA
jgi:hypothetical protein